VARNEQLIRQHKILQILERYRFGRTLDEIRHELVEELGLTSLHSRTVRRDLEALQAAGIDVDPHGVRSRPEGAAGAPDGHCDGCSGALLSLLNRVKLLRLKRWRIAPRLCDLGVESVDDLDCIHCDRCRCTRASIPKSKPIWNWLLLAASLCAALVWWTQATKTLQDRPATRSESGSRSAAIISDDLPGESRPVDMPLILKKIEGGELSDHEALYYEKDIGE